jgi:dihydroorotase
MLMLIKGGRVIDPGRMDGIYDILVKDGKIAEITSNGSTAFGSELKQIDAVGKIVTPGLIDMHVHLREPGQEYKETIKTGCYAAARGGFTAVCPMPNTNPVNDNRQVTEYILDQASREGKIRVYPVGAISKGLKGMSLSEYGDLKDAGAVALSDDGLPVMNSMLMRRAMEYAGGFGLPIISHCEDLDLAAGGAMNEGGTATRMGLPGIPNASETIMIMRDIALCELTGTPLHIAHVSAKESVRAIREAKARGVQVTAETAPHYFTLTHDAVKNYNTSAKMNPPLRSEADREAVRQGLADGVIDVIATDHAPHAPYEKDLEFELAANGVAGLETSLPLSLQLVEDGLLSLTELIKRMSKAPGRIIGMENSLKVGAPADITIIDLEKSYRIDASSFASLGKNTPFDGMQTKGRAAFTIVGGEVVWEAV